jgi:hypothetical protein
VHDEYRVTVRISGTFDSALETELEADLAGVDVSIAGDEDRSEWKVYAYADSDIVASRALDRLPVLLDDHELTILSVRLDRWNDRFGVWQDPSKPLPPPRPVIVPPSEEVEEPHWEVQVHAPSRDRLQDVRDELEDDGYWCVKTGWHRFSVLAYEPDDAAEIADRIRTQLPLGSSVETRSLSSRRLWLLRDVLGSAPDEPE